MTVLQMPPRWALVPGVARVQDCLDGGDSHFDCDRRLAARLVAAARWLPDSVRINRAHGPRVLDCFTTELGIDQVLDLGCGYPHDENRRLPDAVRRIVHVDDDPVVIGHAHTVLAARPGAAAVRGDLTQLPALLAQPEIATLDRRRPVGVLLHDVLPWMADHHARALLAGLREWLPPGSAVSVTHATDDLAPHATAELIDVYAEAGIAFRPRSIDHLESLLRPWPLLDGHGPVTTAEWRSPSTYARLDNSHAYAVVALV
ncbi:SAM-dependent methyltransferase [Streptomyces sp. NPDC018347]|uniref:SAM-dependent methyltransferase n=1 Tax=Streptomyces sp. NPDC018347 TaxID=3157193 RepID=UPI00340E2A56